MGISHHPFLFLLYAKNKMTFGNVVTLGRQNLFCAEFIVRDKLAISGEYEHGVYCEDLLENYMSAEIVESIDNSEFEGATYVHDMNKPVPDWLKSRYDTVIDSGTTEHVFNVSQALKNCSELCKPGGQILHISPANNHCGHGFWQFSPELFFSLYCEENGYEETEVYIADITNFNTWARVIKPENGLRAIINSSSPLYVMARTRKKIISVEDKEVQQSDYQYRWKETETQNLTSYSNMRLKIKYFARTSPRFQRFLFPLYKLYYKVSKRVNITKAFSRFNPHLKIARIDDYLNDRM